MTCVLLYSAQEVTSSLLAPVLANYIAQFIKVLTSRGDEDTDPGLRKEVILALSSLLHSYPEQLQPHLLVMVTPVWDILVTITET